MTGSIKGKKREKLLSEIENGIVDIVIGTHALIEDDVIFNKLGLIVIDEQHRFGVNQRRLLREKKSRPPIRRIPQNGYDCLTDSTKL